MSDWDVEFAVAEVQYVHDLPEQRLGFMVNYLVDVVPPKRDTDAKEEGVIDFPMVEQLKTRT